MDFLLVNANCRNGTSWRVRNLGLAHLSSWLKSNGMRGQVLDGNLFDLPQQHVIERILSLDPALVGFSVYFTNFEETVHIVRAVRDGGYRGTICLGGHHAAFSWKEILEEEEGIDSVVLGEGEGALLDIVARAAPPIAGAASRNCAGIPEAGSARELIEPLDALPFPDCEGFEDFLKQTRRADLVSSRGCYGRCTFCSVAAFTRLSRGKAWRAYSPEALVEEMARLHCESSVEYIAFWDDNFIGPGYAGALRVESLAAQLGRAELPVRFQISCRPDDVSEDLLRALKSVGLDNVQIGVESWVPRQLAFYGKALDVEANRRAVRTLDSLGIDYQIFMIPLDPFVTFEEVIANIEETRAVGVRHLADLADFFNWLYVLKGTPVLDTLANTGILEPPGRFRGPLDKGYRFRHPGMEEAVEQLIDINARCVRLLADIGESLDMENQGERDFLVSLDLGLRDDLLAFAADFFAFQRDGKDEEAAEKLLGAKRGELDALREKLAGIIAARPR